MSLAAVLSRVSIRIFVHCQLASRGGTGIDGWGSLVESSRHRVSSLRSMSVPVGLVAVGIPAPVIGTVSLRGVGTSPRAVRVGGVSIVILWSNFAMLIEGRKGMRNNHPPVTDGEQYLAVYDIVVCFRASPRTVVVYYPCGRVNPLGMHVTIL